MFRHQTVLLLRPVTIGARASAPVHGWFRNYYYARNVVEVKGLLLRWLQGLNAGVPAPDCVVIDAGQSNTDFKAELERWMSSHPRLDPVRVEFPAKPGWVRRIWKRWVRREATTATSA